jgi:hypothetical protein
MHFPSSLKITALGLAFRFVAFAQSSVPPPPTPAVVPPGEAAAPSPSPQQLPMVTQSSRVRAFNPSPAGEVRSLYLQNGSVVDLAPGLGGQLGPAVRKGEKITVTGTKSEINGQSLVEAASVRLNDQTFSATATPGPAALAQGAAPPQAGALQAPPAPAPRRRNRAAAPAPCGATADAPPMPEGLDGPPPPPPGFEAGPPPPPPGGAAPPPPPDGMAPPPPPQN